MIKINDLLGQLTHEVRIEMDKAYDDEENDEFGHVKINRLEEIKEALDEVCTLVSEINQPIYKLKHD